MKFKQFLKRLFLENIVLKICMLVFAFALAVAVSAIPPAKSVPVQENASASVVWETNA